MSRANITNAICHRQDSDERHPGRTSPSKAPDRCLQRGTWAAADVWQPLLLCNQVATESKCRMAWCEMRSHTESWARRLQAYQLLCQEEIARVSGDTQFHSSCHWSITFYFVSLVSHCEEVWWVIIALIEFKGSRRRKRAADYTTSAAQGKKQ